MALPEYQVAGLEYLDLVTRLLHRVRLAHPTAGVWEAADLQWWWRRDQHRDPGAQTFWLLDDVPVAAVTFTDWGDRWGCDLIGTNDSDTPDVLQMVWPTALRGIDARSDRPIEIEVRDDDLPMIDAVVAGGFEATEGAGVATWMPSPARPEVATLPEGFELIARSDDAGRPHPMIPRNGKHVAERLAECSLYRPDLDLAVYAPTDEVAGYGLFWADPATGVGLVEPMRTERAYQRMGLGRCLLTEGLDRLARAGSSRFKVSYLAGNEAARRLYLGVGFRPSFTSRTYRRFGG